LSAAGQGLSAPRAAARLVMAAYHGAAEPALALTRRKRRLAAFGVDPAEDLPVFDLDIFTGPTCTDECDFTPGTRWDVVDRYLTPAGRAGGWAAAARDRLRLTPMVIDLARYETHAEFEADLRKRSSRTLPKARHALKAGYSVRCFPTRRHVYDIHAVKTSMRMRTAGPVLDYWLLRPEDIAPPATRPIEVRLPDCRQHWTLWWGVFQPARGHRQGTVAVDERLVAYVKLTRRGDLLHYVDIMGHRDHLGAGVMTLLHNEIMRWLIESGDLLSSGVRIVLYGAAEHGGEGLLTWKKRAGFQPARLRLAAPSAGR
jgi:GNAT superfamily N-acetyltransferase